MSLEYWLMVTNLEDMKEVLKMVYFIRWEKYSNNNNFNILEIL